MGLGIGLTDEGGLKPTILLRERGSATYFQRVGRRISMMILDIASQVD
jgi:hypothetical protein